MDSYNRAVRAAGVFGLVVVGWLGLSVVPRLESALQAVGGPQSCPAAVDRLGARVEALRLEVKELHRELERLQRS